MQLRSLTGVHKFLGEVSLGANFAGAGQWRVRSLEEAEREELLRIFAIRTLMTSEAAHSNVRPHRRSTSLIWLVSLEPWGERLVAYLERRTPWDS